jgi:peptide/nickel transport system substrate-binding protein
MGSAAALLAACSGTKQDEKKEAASSGSAPGTVAAAAGQPAKRGGRLGQINGASTNSLNPVTNYTEGFVLGGVHVYDRLISQRPNKDSGKEYVLEAAQSVEQPDPTTIIFKLRPGMTFQDRAPVGGRAVSAEDIVKTQIHVRDNPRAQNSSFQTVSMQSVEGPDAQTVVFKLKAPNAYLFSDTQLASPSAQCIIPQETLDKLDDGWQIGSGPYQLAEYELNVRYLYKRFDGFREAGQNRPLLDEREWRVIIDPAAQEAAFRSEQAHIWNVPLPRIADTVKKDLGSKIETDEYVSLSMVTLSANATRPPLNDVRVREALYRVTNRQQYLDLLEQGKGKLTPGPFSA